MTPIKLEEAYFYGGRQICVQGERSLEGLDLTVPIFGVQMGDQVTWEGIRSIEVDKEPMSDADGHLLWSMMKSTMKNDDGRSVLGGLRRLSLHRTIISLPVLEKIFANCPRLATLSCALSPRNPAKGDEFIDKLEKLMQGPGANVQELNAFCCGWTVTDYLEVLRGCPILRLTGWDWGSRLPAWHDKPLPESIRRTREFELTWCDPEPSWEIHIPDPYVIASTIRGLLGKGCTTTIRLCEHIPNAHSEPEIFWMRILNSVMANLIEEKRRAEKKGWKIVQAAEAEQ